MKTIAEIVEHCADHIICQCTSKEAGTVYQADNIKRKIAEAVDQACSVTALNIEKNRQ